MSKIRIDALFPVGDRSQLNATQRAGLDAMDLLSKALGIQFYVFESDVDADGNHIGENGRYDPKDGSIHIDLHAGIDGKGTILFTVAHELTHYIRQWSPAKFKVLANYLMEQYGKQGVPVNELIVDQIAKAKRDNRTIDREEAFEELVADSMETMLNSGKVLQCLADLRKQDSTLAEKIRNWFKDFAEKLKGIVSAYKNVNPDTEEGRLVADMKDVISTFEALYGDALLDAAENFSLDAPIEQTADLLAYHNITAQQLMDALDRNSLLMPSLAITNKGMTDFGELSLLFDKSTIDPTTNSENKLYGSDAWTPQQNMLKKNAKFDVDKTVRTVNTIKNRIGSKFAPELFNVTAKQFRDAIIKADGNIFDVYSHHIGMQTAYAMEQGIISKIPTNKNGTLDTVTLQEQLDKELDTDDGWRQYRKWLRNISDTIITSYDTATNEDIISNMRKQPATAKAFKLSENGELVVPAVEYSSIEQMRKNKNRLSENAQEATKTVADEFMSFAKRIDGNMSTVVSVINAAFASRYSTSGIVDAFNSKGIKISSKTASELQALYKKAVELPTQYFEGKPHREVALDEIKAVVMPADNNLTELKSRLADQGISVVEYQGDSKKARIDALNSVENLKFSGRNRRQAQKNTAESGVKYSKKGSRASMGYATAAYNQWDVETALWDAMDHADKGQDNLIRVGNMPHFVVNTLGIDGDFYIYRNHAYENMVSEEQAYNEGRYTAKSHYHNIGLDKMTEAIMSLENPVLTVATKTKEGNPAVIMVLPVMGKNNAPLYAMLSFYSNRDINGSYVRKPHVVLTVAERDYREHGGRIGLLDIVENAVKDRRVISFDKEKRDYLSVNTKATSLGIITEKSLEDNLAHFRKEIKAFKEKNKINYSTRDPAQQKIRKALERENAQLKEDVSRLEELVKLQRTGTGGAKFTKTSVEAAARMLKKYANVKRMANTSELTQLLHTFYEHIATEKELSWEKVREQAQPAVRWLQDHVDLKEERGEYAQTILNQMKDSRICLDESQRAEAAYRFGSYNDFRKALFGKVTLVSDGNTSLDSWWHSMADQFPDVFHPDTSSTDMPGELFDIIEQLRNTDNSRVEYEYNRASIAMDLTRQVYDSYWRVSTLYTVADRAQQKIDRLKGHHYQQMNKLRAEQNARIEQIKEDNRADRQRIAESRQRTEVRRKILRVTDELNRLLLREDKKHHVPDSMKNAVASVAVSIILNNALVAIVYAGRDDDETYAEKYMQSFVSNMLDDINPITYYPFLKDMWSLLQGFDVERADMSLIGDIADAMKRLTKAYVSEDGDVSGAWWDVADAVVNLTGFPLQNIRRDVVGAKNFANTLIEDVRNRNTTLGSMGDSLEVALRDSLPVFGWLSSETKADKLYGAIINGDTVYEERLQNSYVGKDGKFDKSAYHAAIRKGLRNNDPRIKKAAQARLNGDHTTASNLLNQIAAEGIFARVDIAAAIKAEYNHLKDD